MTKKKLIAITMCVDDRDMITKDVAYDYIRREYGESIQRAGAVPIYIDSSTDVTAITQMVDGVVIGGGYDIDPHQYGEENRYCDDIEPVTRTNWEQQLIAACDEAKVPILGVCYGCQLLNIHYGGTLVQDIQRQHPDALFHGDSDNPVTHSVTFETDCLDFVAGQAIDVVSRHHQAVDQLGEGMNAVAHSEDGVIEAIAGHGHVGVQWHPESSVDSAHIYEAFVKNLAH